MTTKSIKLSTETQKLIVKYVNSKFAEFPIQATRQRLESIDKALQLESEMRRKYREKLTKDGIRYDEDTQIPTVRAPVSKLANFLIDLYAGPKIFESTSGDPANADAVRQHNAIIEENSKHSGWARNLILYFRDIAKYPYAAISCDWEKEEVISILSDSTAEGANESGASAKVVAREGNVIKRKDPYNCFYDTSVPLNEVHTKGDHSAEIERLSQIALFQLISNLKLSGGDIMNEDVIWNKFGISPHHYYVPSILPQYDKKDTTTGWANFFYPAGISSKTKSQLAATSKSAKYELVKLKARIIPSMFGMKVPGANSVQIWHFYIVNWDTVIFAQRQSNAHSYLSDIYTQVTEEGTGEQAKSHAELLVPIQNVSTTILDLHLAGVRRSVDDRALYDSTRISAKNIDGGNPSAKIAVKPNILKGTIQDAYYPIPYRDDSSASRMNTLNMLANIANETIGFNRPQQGQFQKGNKTLGEYSDVMNNADDDLRTTAKLVHSVALVPLKTIIKVNILQFQPPTELNDAQGNAVSINPADIRRTAMEYKLADGLQSKEQVMDLPTANSLLQLVLQVPLLQQRYDVAELINYIMNSVGFDTSKFDNGGTGGPAPQGSAPTPPPPQG